MTAGGNLVVEGRDKDMDDRGGEKVSAEEVENLVYRLPGVRQVAAVAMPDPVLGERVCLYVVPAPGVTLTLEEVRRSMAGAGIAAFKLPEHLVLTGELPLDEGRQGRQEGAARGHRQAANGLTAGGGPAVHSVMDMCRPRLVTGRPGAGRRVREVVRRSRRAAGRSIPGIRGMAGTRKARPRRAAQP